jgi:Fe2+ or Zn2+ uptake regulation protein
MSRQSPRLRETRQRREVYRSVAATATHPTAEWIFSSVRRKLPNISLGTVYRNLSVLRDEGLVREIIGHDRCARYDANTMPHAHFLCTDCGFIADVASPLPSVDWSTVSELVGCEVEVELLELRGRCASCRNRADEEAEPLAC